MEHWKVIHILHLSILAKLFFEDSKRARSTNIMSHQDIHIDPNILAWAQHRFLGSPGEDLLGHRHCSLDLIIKNSHTPVAIQDICKPILKIY